MGRSNRWVGGDAPSAGSAELDAAGGHERDRVDGGAVGSTGASTGCHLHFEVHLDGIAIDALPFMAARGIVLG